MRLSFEALSCIIQYVTSTPSPSCTLAHKPRIAQHLSIQTKPKCFVLVSFNYQFHQLVGSYTVLRGQRNRRDGFPLHWRQTREKSHYYFVKRIIVLTDIDKGNEPYFFHQALLESSHSIQFSFGKLADRGWPKTEGAGRRQIIRVILIKILQPAIIPQLHRKILHIQQLPSFTLD